MSRKCLLDCSANGAKWADDVHLANHGNGINGVGVEFTIANSTPIEVSLL